MKIRFCVLRTLFNKPNNTQGAWAIVLKISLLLIFLGSYLTGFTQSNQVDFSKMIRIYGEVYNNSAGKYERNVLRSSRDSVGRVNAYIAVGFLHSIELKLNGHTKYDRYIKDSLRIEVMVARGTTLMETFNVRGIDSLNSSGFFNKINEVTEDGDRLIFDFGNTLVSRDPRYYKNIIFINASQGTEHFSNLLFQAEERNVYRGNTEIIIDNTDPNHWYMMDSLGRANLKGFIRLNNCQFKYPTPLGIDTVKIKTIRNFNFTELTLVDCNELNLEFKDSNFDKLKIVNTSGIYLGLSNVAFSEIEIKANGINELRITGSKTKQSHSFSQSDISKKIVHNINISGSFDKIVIEKNEFNPVTPTDGILIGAEAKSINIVSNIFNMPVDLFGLSASSKLSITNNVIQGAISLSNYPLLGKSVDIRWGQIAGHKLSVITSDHDSLNLNEKYLYTGMDSDILDNRLFDQLMKSYQRLIDYYNEIGDNEAAHEAYLEKYEVELSNLETSYQVNGGISNFIGWKRKQVVNLYIRNKVLSFLIITIVLGAATGQILSRRKKKKSKLPTKKLLALVFSDIVDYTSMMGKDEKKTMKIIDLNRSIHKIMADRHNGELLKEMGDGMLCSFNTASDAVLFCIDVQRETKQKTYKLRMGVHLGEVMFSKRDVFGDGVNIASRLEGEATDGGICISGTVYQNIRNQPDIEVEFIGERELKHVTTKVEVYGVKY